MAALWENVKLIVSGAWDGILGYFSGDTGRIVQGLQTMWTTINSVLSGWPAKMMQAGVDMPLGGGWLLNADVKKVQIGTKVLANDASVGKFKVDPLLFGIGIGKRF